MENVQYFLGVLNGLKAILNTKWKDAYQWSDYFSNLQSRDKCLREIDELVERSFCELINLKEYLMHPYDDSVIENYFYMKFLKKFEWSKYSENPPKLGGYYLIKAQYKRDSSIKKTIEDVEVITCAFYCTTINEFILPYSLGYHEKLSLLLEKYKGDIPQDEINKLKDEGPVWKGVTEWLKIPYFDIPKKVDLYERT